jgi:hypothetical protein
MAAKNENEPIDAEEILVRRARSEKMEKFPIVSKGAFLPRVKGNDPDTEGISLYRLSCLDDPQEALSTLKTDDQKNKTGLVALKVSEIQGLSVDGTPLQVVSDPLPIDDANRIPGHVVIKGLDAPNYKKCKEDVEKAMGTLARFASAEKRCIVKPPVLEDDNDKAKDD